MKRWTAKTRTQVWGRKNAWSLSAPKERAASSIECEINLEILGNPKGGFHLVMSPDGFFTADSWTETLDEAFHDSSEMFDLDRSDWTCHDDK